VDNLSYSIDIGGKLLGSCIILDSETSIDYIIWRNECKRVLWASTINDI